MHKETVSKGETPEQASNPEPIVCPRCGQECQPDQRRCTRCFYCLYCDR